jgi:hypothetical protein
MPTPRKPGAKRGRPPKPKAPPKKAGRKPVTINKDKDGHAVSLTDALLRNGDAASENAACLVAATLCIGIEIEAQHGKASNEGLVRTSWKKRSGRGVAATFKGYAATLRWKRKKYSDPTSMQWRQAMARAFEIARTSRGPDAKNAVRALASSVGERRYAERVLMKWMDARESESPNATVRWPELTG